MLILLIVTFEYKICFSEGDLAEQAEDVTVEVTRFTRGSVVCDFKVTDISPSSATSYHIHLHHLYPLHHLLHIQVNYILKEAYIAIPFSIKPSNITNIMGQNFKFKKGVLFQVSHYQTTFDGLFQ